MTMRERALAAVVAGTCVATAAGGSAAHAEAGIVSEVRLGVLAHDIGLFGGREGSADLNGEVLFTSPFPQDFGSTWPQSLRWLARPRPHIGVEINTGGATSQLYLGLTWTAPLARDIFRQDDGLDLNLLFGPAFNDGHTDNPTATRKALGSNVLFHLGAEFSYRITERISIGAYYDHSSNGNLARHNQSLNNAGLRMGIGF